MKRWRFILLSIFIAGIFGVLLFYVTHFPRTDLRDIDAVFERVQQAGGYRFSADIVQETIPLPQVTNIGRQSRAESMYIEGQANNPEQKMELDIWSGGVSSHNQDDALQLRVEQGQAQARRPGGEWEVLDEYASLVAPEGDMLAYLTAAKNVSNQGGETRNGITYTRYTFQIDGPAFAAYLRAQMEQRMHESGELPAGMSLDLPQMYAEMEGEGELWVGEDGLPVRQLIYLQFPNTTIDQVEARIDVTFSDYLQRPKQAYLIPQLASFFTGDGIWQVAIVILFMAVFMIMLAFRRSKLVYASVVILVIASMLLTPLLESAQVKAFADNQLAQRQEAETFQQEEQLFESLREKLVARLNTPLEARQAGVALQNGYSRTALSLTSLAGNPQPLLQEDNGEDSDADGLTDYQEQHLGTDPQDPDTDGDGVSDTVEVLGFEYPAGSGKRWYTNPLAYDTNEDGMPDPYEYADPVNGVPADADQDGVPDLFTDDNDSDGVPDDKDLSPNQSTKNGTLFDRARPFVLKIDNLSKQPTYVEFQLRPINDDHLWYAQNVLDWPKGDLQGQLQDVDGRTYADKYGTAGSGTNAENGDMKLIPLLEISLSGVPDNLPITTTLKSLYGINVLQRSLVEGEKTVYVPLQPVIEPDGGARLAFYGKMLYEPKESWNDQKVRLVWIVQALMDECKTYDEKTGLCATYTAYNQPKIIQVYYDEWYLTGLNIQENLGYTQGIIWEDPSEDDNLVSDDMLTLLTYQLDKTFLAGRDVEQDGKLDITIDEIERRFDRDTNAGVPEIERWDIPNALQVYSEEFTHADEGLSTLSAMTTAHTTYLKILEDAFNQGIVAGEEVTPTLLILSEERFRTANLDDAASGATLEWSGNKLSVDMSQQGSVQLAVSERWQSYRFDGSRWTPLSAVEQWDEMVSRYRSLYQDEPDQEEAERKCQLLAYYNLALYRAQSNLIRKGGVTVDLEASSDADLAEATGEIGGAVMENLGTRLFRRATREFVKDIPSALKKPAGSATAKTLTRLGTGIEFTVLGMNMLAALLEDEIGEDAAVALNVTGNFMLATALVLDDIIGGYKAFAAAKEVAELSTSAKIWKFAKQVDVKGATAGFLLDLAIIWGMFTAQYFMGGGADMGALQLHALIATAFVTTLIALTIFIIALVTCNIVAIVIELILLIIDIFLMIFGESTLTEKFADALTEYTLLAEPDAKIEDTNLIQDPDLGLVAPSKLVFTVDVTEKATQKDPDNWMTERVGHHYWFDYDKLRNSAVVSNLSTPISDTVSVKTTHGTMNSQWGGLIQDHSWYYAYSRQMYRLEKEKTHQIEFTLDQPGINISLPVYLNLGYDVPYVSCIFYLVYVDCDVDYQAGETSIALGDSIILDVLPATLDEFYRLYSPERGFRLAWDTRFPVLRDADGDGLLSAAYGGGDPNDADWDSDDDGLSDAFEFERRQIAGSAGATSLLSKDTDYDGLCDDQEIYFGTHPNQRDSDGDGLLDSEEIYHQDTCDSDQDGDRTEWVGGWSYTVGDLIVQVTSDPLYWDTDGDGLDDKAERTLGENPRAWTENPMLMTLSVDDEDRIVKPGQSLVYTVTLQNAIESEVPMYCLGDLSVKLPSPMGGQTLTETLNIAQGSSQFLQREVSVDSGATSGEVKIENAFAGQMNDGDLTTYWTMKQENATALLVNYANYAGFPPYISITTYPTPTITNTYAVAELARAGEESQARVNLRQLVDNFTEPTDVYAGDTQFPRRFLGSFLPGVACNDDGRCLVLWERSRYDPSALLHLDEIKLTTSGNVDGSGDSTAEVEFWGYLGYRISRAKTLSWSFGPENATGYLFYRGPTKPTDYPVSTYQQGNREVSPCLRGQSCSYGWWFNVSQGASLSIVEKDCSFWTGCEWDGSGTPASYTFRDFDPFHPNYRTWDWWSLPEFYIDVANDPDGWARIGVTAFYDYGDGIYASVVDKNRTNLSRRKTIVEEGTTSGNNFGQPAVASDGQDFLVVYARKYTDSGSVKNGIFAQVVLANGNSSGDAHPIRDTSVSFEHSWPKVIWMEKAQRYLVIWNDGGTWAALVNQNGAVEWKGTLTGAAITKLEQVPDLAYNPTTGEALLVYIENNKLYSKRIRQSTQTGGLEWDVDQVINRLTSSDSEIQWPSVAYEPFSGGWVVSWIDRITGDTSWLSYLVLDNQGQVLQHKAGLGDSAEFTPVQIQKSGKYRQQDTACRNLTSTTEVGHCAISGLWGSSVHQNQYAETFSLAIISPYLGSCDPPATALSLWVDGTGPQVTIALQENAAYAFDGIVTIGGEANDPGEMASGVESVWVSMDNVDSWAQATGAEAWAYNWTVPVEDKSVTLQVKAKDKLGNWGAETAVTIILDRSAPGALAMVQPANANPIQVSQDGSGIWRLPITIQAADTGSGVAAVSASLEPLGSGWQEATFDGTYWTLAYPLSPLDPDTGAVAQPTGAYTVRLSAQDKAGNTRTEIVPWLVQVDNTPPEVSLTFPDLYTQVITQTVELTGVISDTGSVASGVNLVEIAVVPAGGEPTSWTPITPDVPGAVVSTWRYLLPGDLDGLYQIWLRGSDLLGNQREAALAGQFLVEIDTLAPQAACTLAYRGAGSAAQTVYSASAQDFNLSQDVTGLLVTGFKDVLPLQFSQKYFYDDPWYLRVISDTTRLNRMEFSGVLNGHTPLSFTAGDRREHSIQVECQNISSSPPALSSAVLDPAHGAAITTSGLITITGGANAVAGLAALSLTANGIEIYSTTWAAPVPTDTLWSTSWLPEDGIYELIPVVTDVNGQVQADLQPIVVTVDRQPPVVTLASSSLSIRDRISYNRVWLTGTASDNLGLAGVEVSDDGGMNWQPASLDGASWRFDWSAGGVQEDELDGITKQVKVRAVDTAGLITQIDPLVTVDLQAPTPVTMTLSLDAAGMLPLAQGQTVRESSPNLFINWSPSSDGGGAVTYWAGWSPEQAVEFTDLQEVQGAYQYAQPVDADLQVLYAHLILRDVAGNERHLVDGPIYIDQPGPPDLVSDLHYQAWMDETCNLVGADYEVTHYASTGASLNKVQELYASWDDANLRLTYTGAFWDHDGDLFIYLDTMPGGATTAYDPYGMGPVIQLPGGFTADKLLFVEDTQAAMLLTWNGGGWEGGLLAEGQFRYDAGAPGYTDLLLPWASLGNPGSIKMLALASEEDALRIWAAIPEKNPLNSERAVDTLASAYLDRSFSLRHFLTLNREDACPNGGQVAGSDLHFSLSASPNGAVAGYLADDFASLLSPGIWLDNDLNGLPDLELPIDMTSAWVGEGQSIVYTLTYTNTGTVAAQDVVVNLTARGLSLNGENPIPIGTVAAGEGGVLTIPADMLAGVLSGELRLEIADAQHGPFEWLWALHRVDKEPPQGLTIETPALYVHPGQNLITGRVFDPSGVASVTLSVTPPGQPTDCQPPSAGDDLWICTWTPPADGSPFQARIQASDIFGNTSGWTAVKTWMLDDIPPTVRLSEGSGAALADGKLLPAELLLSGSITDDHVANAVKVCAKANTSSLEICEWARMLPGSTPDKATWEAQVPIAGIVDGILHSLSITGYDAAGNPSIPMSYQNLNVDLAGPAISITEYHPNILQAQLTRMLSGSISDGSGVKELSISVADPSGNTVEYPCTNDTSSGQPCTLVGGAWQFSASFIEVGRYALTLEARDMNETISQRGPVYVQVLERGTATDLSLELSASPGTAISGLPLTYTASIHNAGPGIAAGMVLTATLPAEVGLASAPTFCRSNVHNLVCSIPDTLPVDNSLEVKFTVNVPIAVTTTLTCDALVGSVTIDLEANNNRRIVNTPVIQPVAGLSVSSSSPTSLGAATVLTATVTQGYPVYFRWDFGDGQTGDGAVVNHYYLARGIYTASVTAFNDYNQMVASTQVEVINLAPQVISTGMDQITYEDELTWTGYIYFTDLNIPDSHTATIDWGDGQASVPDELIDNNYGGMLRGSHIYADPGVYNATIIVQDAYGGIGMGSFPITVLHGFMRFCAYADGQDPGVTIYPQARLNCGWNQPDQLTRQTASGAGSRGYIQIQDGVVITGSLRSQGQAVITGADMRLVGGQVVREFDLLTNGNIDSQGNVNLGIRANIARDIASRANVSLGAQSFVGGNVTANGKVTLGAGAIISGTITEKASLPSVPPITPVTLSFVAGWEDISIAQGAVKTLKPGKYRNLTVKKNATLMLQSGRYIFESISLEQDASIKIDLSDGALLVDVVKTLFMGEGTQMVITSSKGSADKILFRVAGNTIYLKKGGIYLGTYLAPNGQARLGEDATLTGALYGKSVHVMNRAEIIGMPARNLFALTMVNPNLPLGCSDRVTCKYRVHLPIINP